jgi:hypothetical protein
MPTVNLSDLVRMRLQTISFFLVVLLLSAGFVRLIWNHLGKDFAFLPRLSYGKALGVVVLWGLLFVLVLTMISGARELMTPGAWKKDGATYKLAGAATPPVAAGPSDQERVYRLNALRNALWEYARAHGSQLPASREASGIAAEKWQVPGPARLPYVYVGGQTADEGAAPLAYEPEVFGRQSYVLLTDGSIRPMEHGEIISALRAGGQQ